MISISTPISDEDVNSLKVGDRIYISGEIFCGRDAVLPKLVSDMNDDLRDMLNGGVIFHTAVSPAGVGPTSSNKVEIENSIIPLSECGVKLHLGKGELSRETINGLERNNAVYAVIPPVTALLETKTFKRQLIAYGELGMEAFYKISVEEYPAIVAVAHGRSIFDE